MAKSRRVVVHIKFDKKDKNPTRVVIDEKGKWRAEDRLVEEALDAMFGPNVYPSGPSDGAFPQSAQIRAVQNAYPGTTVDWPEVPSTKGRIH